MSILVVTGQLARQTVENEVERSGADARVIALPAQVAALMTPQYIARILRSTDLGQIDTILVPGMVRGDVSSISQQLGIRTFKGPRHSADLPPVLGEMNHLQLSTSRPACELMRTLVSKHALRELATIEREARRPPRGVRVVRLRSGRGSLLIGRGLPMKLLAEIVDAPTLSDIEIQKEARRFVSSGADIVDVGMTAGGGHPSEARRALRAAKRAVSNPVSIDTNDVEEMRVAVRAGADMILSVNAENMRRVSKFASKLPVVVTPATEERICPEDPEERVEQLRRNLEEARSLGFKCVIADPVLSPLFMTKVMDSLAAYYEFVKKDATTPVLFGAGNVAELVDADSVGVNMILAGLAEELGASILLTTEASDKTRGSVEELAIAIRMARLASHRRSPPKDLGFDLLRLKEKRRKEVRYEAASERGAPVAVARRARRFIYDPRGCFKIRLDRNRHEIVIAHLSYGKAKPTIIVKGTDPMRILSAVIRRGLVSRLDHAAYLGVELEKAQVALQTGKSYVQDTDLTWKELDIDFRQTMSQSLI